MTYCGEQTAVKREAGGLTAVSLKCRSWRCPDCAPNRTKQLIAEAIGGAPQTFLTLTSRKRDGITAEQATLELSRAWRLLRLRILRKYRLARLPFFAVVEAHKSGWPHLHILMRAPFLSWKWMSEQMRDILNSPHVDIRRIDNKGRVAAYCAKYCAKANVKFGTAKRYWQSKDYDLRPEPESKDKERPGEGWEIWYKNISNYLSLHEQLGHLIVKEREGCYFIWIDDP